MTDFFQSKGLSEIGQRSNNEDAIFPNSEIDSPLTNLFLVCDGVGGHAKGEIASDLVCSQLPRHFTERGITRSTNQDIEEAVSFVENQFDSYMLASPEAEGMGTTMTLLHLHEGGATLAHIGDSRIYHLRDGEVLHRSKDHSFVQALVDLGEISEEEARTHPRRNQITNAIQGASVRRAKPTVQHIQDLKAGDLFILCTDGVLESIFDEDLKDYSREGYEVDTIALKIRNKCQDSSRDNFSYYIVKLQQAYIDSLQPSTESSASNEQAQNAEPALVAAPGEMMQITEPATPALTVCEATQITEPATPAPTPCKATQITESDLPSAPYETTQASGAAQAHEHHEAKQATEPHGITQITAPAPAAESHEARQDAEPARVSSHEMRQTDEPMPTPEPGEATRTADTEQALEPRSADPVAEPVSAPEPPHQTKLSSPSSATPQATGGYGSPNSRLGFLLGACAILILLLGALWYMKSRKAEVPKDKPQQAVQAFLPHAAVKKV